MNVQQIRSFHNSVKTDIINDAYISVPYTFPVANVRSSVLDLACGRGGDVHKYFHANFGRVVAVDNHSASLDEAKCRYERTYSNNFNFNVDFIVHDLKKPLPCVNQRVDAVVMNFALNYFFDSSSSLNALFQTVSSWLRPDGVFTGIALDGARVFEQSLETDIYKIVPSNNYFDTSVLYDRAYMFSFNEKQNHYFDLRGSTTEFLLDIKELDRVAATFGMYPQTHRHFTCDDPVLKMDVVFKYVMPSSYHCLYTQRFFPSCMHSKYLEIMPDTETVCSRPQASFLLVKIIQEQYDKPIKCIMDATAHVGTDTICLAMNFTESSIIAVEQDPPTSVVLDTNIKKCGFTNVTVLMKNSVELLSERKYDVDVLYIDAPWGGSAYKSKKKVSLSLNDTDLSEIIVAYCKNVPFIILKVPNNFDTVAFTQNTVDRTIRLFPYIVHDVTKFNFLMVT